MSRDHATFTFADGSVWHGVYDGTVDSMYTFMRRTPEEAWAQYEDQAAGKIERERCCCTVSRKREVPVKVVAGYGNGMTWKGTACLECRVFLGPRNDHPTEPTDTINPFSSMDHAPEGPPKPTRIKREAALAARVTAEEELARFTLSVEYILAQDVMGVLDVVAGQTCPSKAVLGGDPCGKCPVCLLKPLADRITEECIRATWRNRGGDLNTYWRALYAIRCTAEHVTLPGKKTRGRRRKELLHKIIMDVENMRDTADRAIQAVKGAGR